MATITCAYSGIVFKCDHFPMALNNSECSHPVFLLPQHKLLSYSSKWSAGELTTTDSYLLFLALMNSTSLLEWRHAVHRTNNTDALVATNMEPLIKIIGKINLIHHPKFVLPSFAITRDTCTLENVKHWVEAWHESFLEFMRGYKEQTEQERISRREYALERMIKSTQLKNAKKYSIALANWAELAGQFPSFVLLHPLTKNPITLANYWKEIITACIREEKIFQYPAADVEELITHCEEHIPHGSISAASLMDLLRAGKRSQSSYLCLSDFDIVAFKNGTLSSEDVVETTNKLVMMQNAPTEMPVRTNYSSEIEFVRAKARYRMKQQYGAIGEVITSSKSDKSDSQSDFQSDSPAPARRATDAEVVTVTTLHKHEDI